MVRETTDVLLFFPGLQMRKYSAWHTEDTETPWFSASDTEIYIDASGELLTGTLCKKTLGAASNGIVHKAWLIDNDKACRLVSRIQFLVNKWLLTHGFSVGISDCVTKNTGEVTSLIDDNMRRIDTILENAVKTGVHPSKKEGTISTILNNARDVSGRYVQKDLTTKNNLFTMVSGGSKGECHQHRANHGVRRPTKRERSTGRVRIRQSYASSLQTERPRTRE